MSAAPSTLEQEAVRVPDNPERTDDTPLDDDPVPLTDACGHRVDDGPHMKVGSVILFRVSTQLHHGCFGAILQNLVHPGIGVPVEPQALPGGSIICRKHVPFFKLA